MTVVGYTFPGENLFKSDLVAVFGLNKSVIITGD